MNQGGGGSRRSFVKRAGATVALGGAFSAGAGVLLADPAGADYTGAVDGTVRDRGGHLFDIKSAAWGAKGDTVRVAGAGSISSGSTSFTWAGGAFVTADVGKVVTVPGAGAAGAVLSTTIASIQSPTQATLTASASTTVTSASFAYGTDDTLAIIAAATAAGSRGRLFAPAGIYMIRGGSNGGNPITLTGSGGLLGVGGKPRSGSASPVTVFLAADATAGLRANGSATYQGFCCDGNKIATAPLQTGTITGGSAGGAGSRAVFFDVWATASAGSGWTIYGAQYNSYYDCGTRDNAVDGLSIDGGSQGLEFWHFDESGSARYGVRGGATYPLGTKYGTSAVRFYAGRFSSVPGQTTGVSKIHLRGATDWRFTGATVVGQNVSGPTVDLDQATGYALAFSGCSISATPSGGSPGLACINVGGSPPAGAGSVSFLRTERMTFGPGDTSVYIASTGTYRYSAIGWIRDSTTHGPLSAAGLAAIDTLLSGRTGAWIPAGVQSPWTGSPEYRMGPDGRVRLRGSVTSSGGGGTIFTLPAGYYDATGSAITVPATITSGTTTVSIDTSGNVSASDPGAGKSLYLDGIAFPVD